MCDARCCVSFQTFGKVALLSRMPFDSISLRDCTAVKKKGDGLVIVSQQFVTGLMTWAREDYGVQTFRRTASKGPPWQRAIRRVTTDMHTGEIQEEMTVNSSGQQFCYATVLGGPRDIRTTLHSDDMQPVFVSSVPLSQLWSESFGPSQ